MAMSSVSPPECVGYCGPKSGAPVFWLQRFSAAMVTMVTMSRMIGMISCRRRGLSELWCGVLTAVSVGEVY